MLNFVWILMMINAVHVPKITPNMMKNEPKPF